MSLLFIPSILLLPITGSIVRYRLAYHPKDSQDDKPTLLSTVKNIRTIEGWSSFHKGLIPVAISFFLILPIFLRFQIPKVVITPAPVTSPFKHVASACLGNTFFLLTISWIYRAISTPHTLSLSQTSIKDAWEALFTSYERSGKLGVPFFSILATPGLVAGMLVNLLFRIVILRVVGHPKDWNMTAQDGGISYGILLVAPFAFLVPLALLAPLEVIVTRLAVQRNYKPSPFISQIPHAWNALAKWQRVLASVMGVLNLVAFVLWNEWNKSRNPDDNKRAFITQFAVVAVDFLVFILFFMATFRKARSGEQAETDSEAVGGEAVTDDVMFDAGDEVDESQKEDKKSSLPLPNPLPEPVIAVTAPEAAVRYRPDDLPQYTGLYDCSQKIIEEEGLGVLYRGWWVTLLGLYFLPC